MLILGSIATVASLITFTAWGMIHPRSRIWARPVYRGSPDDPRVALTFDDGPHPETTPVILDALGDLGVHATFFVIGANAEKYPRIVRRMSEEGHLVGNHSWHHHHYGSIGFIQYWRDEISRTDRLIEDLTGRSPAMFRPPFGFKTWHQNRALRTHPHTMVTFSLRGFDSYATSTPKQTLDRILPRARNGEVISLHDGRDPQVDKPRLTARDVIRPLIAGLRKRGLEPVRLDDLLGVPGWKGEKPGEPRIAAEPVAAPENSHTGG